MRSGRFSFPAGDWLLDPEYLDAHLAMIERLATPPGRLRPMSW